MKRALVGLLLLGCHSKDEHEPVATTAIADAASAKPTGSWQSVFPPPKTIAPCRAIAVSGKVTDLDGGGSLSLGGQLPDSMFTLDDGAKMTVKDPTSGREVTFEGAATVRTCVAGDPEHWLLRGGFSATPGAGEKPGAEEWVITPYGIIRFASAMVKMRIEKDRLTVRVSSGSVSVYAKKVAPPDGGASAPGDWMEATSATPLDLLSPGPAKALVDACASLAKSARDLGSQILQPDANVGELASKHIDARQKARAACALARAAALGAWSGSDKTKEDSALFMRAEAADAEWRIVAR